MFDSEIGMARETLAIAYAGWARWHNAAMRNWVRECIREVRAVEIVGGLVANGATVVAAETRVE